MTPSKCCYERGLGPVFVCALLLCATFVSLVPFAGADDLSTLTGGATQANLVFETAGTNKTPSLTIPKQAQVTSATIDLEGQGFGSSNPVTTDYNYNDSTNNKAWWGQSNNQAQGAPSNYEGNTFAQGEYPNIAKSDDVYKDTSNIQNLYAYHHFSFLVPATDITSISVVWEGGGVATSMIGNGGAYVFIYNNQTGQWEVVGNFACGDVWCEQTIKNTFSTNPDYYPDQNSKVHLLAVTRSAGNSNRITTDFVKIAVTGKQLSFPSSPSLDVGNDGDDEWNYVGSFTGKVTVTGPTLVNELNDQILAAGAGPGDAIIVLSVSSAGAGIIRISNILVQFTPYVDTPPELMLDIPSDKTVKEDTDALNLIDLYTYFKDDHDTVITFQIINNSAPNGLIATIGTDGKMDFTTPAENWWGTVKFIIRAQDSKGQFTDSNEFTVTVTSVNDPPVFDPVPDQHVKEGTAYHFFIHATDVDMALDPMEHITYSSDSPLVTVNAFTGEVSMIDLNDSGAVGSVIPGFSVGFSASDHIPVVTNVTVNFSIENLEFPPVLEHIGNRSLTQNVPFMLQLKASDRDTKDALTYSCTGGLFQCSSDGKIDFVPGQKDVGVYNVTIKVSDGQLSDQETARFTVVDVNDPPQLKPVPDQTADNRRDFVFVFAQGGTDFADGYDSYYNNTHTFSDDTPLFDIDPGTGKVSFRPKVSQTGKYTIHVTVVDSFGFSATTVMNLTIVVKNTLPVVDIAPAKKGSPNTGGKFTLKAVATDQDGDDLKYTWYGGKNGTTLLSSDMNLTQKAGKAGKYTYTVKVSDGIGETVKTYTVQVKTQSKGLLPGFGPVLVLGALAVVAAVSAVLMKNSRSG